MKINTNKYKSSNNSRGVNIEYETIIDAVNIIKYKSPYYYEMIKDGSIHDYQQIFRGINIDKKSYNYGSLKLYNPKLNKRHSVNTENYYTEILDNSIYWKDYPNRSSSIIATTSYERARMYGSLYHIIPLVENAVVAVAPTYDIWISFGFALNKMVEIFKEDKLIKSSRDAFGSMGGFNNFLRIKFGIDKDADYETMRKSIVLTDDVFNELDRESTFDNSRFIYDKDELIKIQNKWGTFMNYIEYLLSPKWNGFSKVNYNNKVVLPTNREVWTNSECLLVEHDLYNKILMSLK